MAYKDFIKDISPSYSFDRALQGDGTDIKLKDLINQLKLAFDAVQSTMEAGSVADGAITSSKLANGAVTPGKIGTGGVSNSSQLAANVITANAIAADAVVTAKVVDGAITTPKLKMFVSTNITGDGNPISTAHGLGVVPATILFNIVTIPANFDLAGTAITISPGTHTTTNVVATAPVGIIYKILAIA